MSAQPDVPYFHWQVEVMIHNFMKLGINPNWIEVLWAHNGQPSKELLAMTRKYPYVRFFHYPKSVANNFGYVPILRPDILEQHFTRFPELRGETIFYHDSDIIFRAIPDFDSMNDDLYWYMSDTTSYIGADYIKSKSSELFNTLCNIVKVSPNIVESNQLNSGGAQQLLKCVNSNFWKTVKEDALMLYKYMSDIEANDRTKLTALELETYNPIQKWCADMWALLWGGLKIGAQPRISTDLSFSWGTSSLIEYEKHNIMHNAGVTDNTNGTLFYKGEFINRNPFDSDFTLIDPNTASFKYVEAILYAKEHRL
jgi:hypothetical protein